jgi:hypothetical protein
MTEGITIVGYTHAFRRLSREYIVDICNKMQKPEKPESYELSDAGLFRDSPCQDWAPLPTPMQTFMSSPGDADQGVGQRRSSRGANANRKYSSQSVQSDDEANWSRGDSSWWKPGGRSNVKQGAYWVKKEDNEREKPDRPQRWVEKAKPDQDSSQEGGIATAEVAEAAPASAENSKEPSGTSWADKVRQGS